MKSLVGTRIRNLVLLAALAAIPCFAQINRPVQMVVGYVPGGLGDVVARVVAEKLSIALGQPVVVENRPGASGGIAAQGVARAKPDGQTLLVGQTGEIAVNKSLVKGLAYDPARDFDAVALIGSAPLALVVPASAPYATFKAMLEFAKSKPLAFASSGTGTPGHLAGELLKTRTKADLSHVPYKGAGQALTDVIAGHVDLFFSSLPAAQPHVKGGKLRILALSSAQRSAAAPDVPTVAEHGFRNFDFSLWVGIFAPRGTPKETVEKLNREINRILALPDIKDRLGAQGLEIRPMSADQTTEFVKAEIAKYAGIVEETGVKGE